MSYVLAVSPVLGAYSYAQSQITAQISAQVAALTDDPVRAQVVERIHANAGVERRYLVQPLEEYGHGLSFGAANAAFGRLGADMAVRACAQALADAGLSPTEVDMVFFTTVTGIGAPGLDVAVAHRLGLRADVRRIPSFGLGCAGGAAALARVDDLLRGAPSAVALVLSVELCSLTLQPSDTSLAAVVAAGLFGDGAAAAVMVGSEHPAASRGVARVVGSRAVLYPDSGADLGWQVRDTGLGIQLTTRLPDMIASNVAVDVKTLLSAHQWGMPDVGTWLVHPGGPRILEAVGQALGLSEGDLHRSYSQLADRGNLSSASVLHLLADATADPDGRARTERRSRGGPGGSREARAADGRPAAWSGHDPQGGRERRGVDGGPGEHGLAVLMAFGPGVCCELVLLEVL